MKLSELIAIDDEHDEVRIAGARVAGVVFRQFATPSKPGRWFRVVRVGEVIVIEQRDYSAPPHGTLWSESDIGPDDTPLETGEADAL